MSMGHSSAQIMAKPIRKKDIKYHLDEIRRTVERTGEDGLEIVDETGNKVFATNNKALKVDVRHKTKNGMEDRYCVCFLDHFGNLHILFQSTIQRENILRAKLEQYQHPKRKTVRKNTANKNIKTSSKE